MWRAMETNEELREKAKAALQKAEKGDEAKTAALVKLAQENGYDVSVEDFSSHQASEHKLSEDELKLSSGGIKGKDGKLYHPCNWDYACGGAWNDCLLSNECFLQSTTCTSNILNAGKNMRNPVVQANYQFPSLTPLRICQLVCEC